MNIEFVIMLIDGMLILNLSLI